MHFWNVFRVQSKNWTNWSFYLHCLHLEAKIWNKQGWRKLYHSLRHIQYWCQDKDRPASINQTFTRPTPRILYAMQICLSYTKTRQYRYCAAERTLDLTRFHSISDQILLAAMEFPYRKRQFLIQIDSISMSNKTSYV